MISLDKTQINIKGEIYNLSEIEFICEEDKNLVVFTHDKISKHESVDLANDFNQIAIAIQLSKIPNYVMFVGDNIINLNNVKKVNYDMEILTLQTNNHIKIIKNVKSSEFLYICGKIRQMNNNKQDLQI